uniref:Uncharacterized protein n=1 Tax=Oryza punctata TaxID=4537 RepID=A0A0E0JUZ3_ORYPU
MDGVEPSCATPPVEGLQPPMMPATKLEEAEPAQQLARTRWLSLIEVGLFWIGGQRARPCFLAELHRPRQPRLTHVAKPTTSAAPSLWAASAPLHPVVSKRIRNSAELAASTSRRRQGNRSRLTRRRLLLCPASASVRARPPLPRRR